MRRRKPVARGVKSAARFLAQLGEPRPKEGQFEQNGAAFRASHDEGVFDAGARLPAVGGRPTPGALIVGHSSRQAKPLRLKSPTSIPSRSAQNESVERILCGKIAAPDRSEAA